MKLLKGVSWWDIVIYGLLLTIGLACGIYAFLVWIGAEPPLLQWLED